MSSQTNRVVFDSTLQVAFSFLEGLDTPRAQSVCMLADAYLNASYDAVLFKSEMDNLGFDFVHYDQFSIDRMRDDYQATVLFSKLPAPFENPALRGAAIDGFKSSESRSASINSCWTSDSKVEALFFESGFDLDELRRLLRKILGRAPSLQNLLNRGSWTEGSSFTLPLRNASSGEKCEKGVSVTYPLAKALSTLEVNPLISTREAWLLVPGNLIDTVPKNIVTDRTIAKEPDINSFVQRAIGVTLRERLLHWGIDLRDQGQNQIACKQAYSRSLATIDLKDASNSVLRGVVYKLLPSDWVDLLDVARSHYGTFSSRKEALSRKADWFEYQMLSSMGNGFTFELETSLFLAIALAAGSPLEDTYVYGDDLIVPQSCVASVERLLNLCGFFLNNEKSFRNGAFFESCGVYTFFGVDVSPLKIKDLLFGNKERVVLANKIRWFAHSCNGCYSCDKRFLRAWRVCISRISSSIRRSCRGPVGSGLTLFCNWEEAMISYSRRRGAIKVHQLIPAYDDKKTLLSESEGLFYYRLFEQERRVLPLMRSERHGNVTKVCASGGYYCSPLFIEDRRDWYDLGPWETLGR